MLEKFLARLERRLVRIVDSITRQVNRLIFATERGNRRRKRGS